MVNRGPAGKNRADAAPSLQGDLLAQDAELLVPLEPLQDEAPLDELNATNDGSLALDFDLSSAISETLASIGTSETITGASVAGLGDTAVGPLSKIPADKLATSKRVVANKAVAAAVAEPLKPKAEPAAIVVQTQSNPEAIVAAVTNPNVVSRKVWRDRLLMRAVPSWMVSMMLHVAILMGLAAIQVDPVRDAIGVMMTAVAGDEAPGIEDSLDLNQPSLEPPAAASMDQELAAASASQFTSQEIALPDTGSLTNPTEMTVDVGKFGSMVENIVPSSALNASASRLSSSLVGRASGAVKSEMLERFGGNAASEKSVAMALKWLANHQDRSGGWTFGHTAICRGQCKDDGEMTQAMNGATALALLPFLGAGQTHLEGDYRTTVQKGLNFLISRMKVTKGDLPTGSWHEPGGRMYSHGLAAIVVCEAYAMTRDPGLVQPAQLAINYIVDAQDPRGGGWRYEPKQAGDTSVVGWQLMAMKSGAMGNLTAPPETFRRASAFLDSISVNNGAYYGYDTATSNIEGKQSTTAVGLLCRMYLGWSKENAGLKEGVKFLAKRGPSVEDLYYSYYGTQVLRQYGGEEWINWNKAMRDGLIKAQTTEGHAAGSWYSPAGHNTAGGRLYCTALSTMILEVYYRHMPLYSNKSSDEDFEF